MDPVLRKIYAATILAGGIVVAMAFRQAPPPAGQAQTEDFDQLVLRAERNDPAQIAAPKRPARQLLPEPPPPQLPQGIARPWVSARPLDPGAPPPELSRSFPWAQAQQAARRADEKRPSGPRHHRVVDGDTLTSLARQYLGADDRYLEIYEANRAILPDPDVLPLGADLLIPAGDAKAPLATDRMVPVDAGHNHGSRGPV